MMKNCKGAANKQWNNRKYTGRDGTHKTVVTVRLDITYHICEC